MKITGHSSDWRRIMQVVDEQLTRYLKAGKSVIYDSANQDKASRQKLAKLAKKA